MTKREAAIVMAYTGKVLGCSDEYYKYLEELFGRPVFTHEFLDPSFAVECEKRSKDDFVNLKIEDQGTSTRWGERGIVNSDNVVHPAHYGGADNPYEAIKVMEAWFSKEEMVGAYKFNLIKYLNRYKLKNGIEDLKKAQCYLEMMIGYLEQREGKPPA